MDHDIELRAALPLFGVGLLTLLMSCCFCCYLWRLKSQGERESGYHQVVFKQRWTGKPEVCPVCLDEFSNGDKVVVTHCSHTFHNKCLTQWLHENNTCPLCKSPVRQQNEEATHLFSTAATV